MRCGICIYSNPAQPSSRLVPQLVSLLCTTRPQRPTSRRLGRSPAFAAHQRPSHRSSGCHPGLYSSARPTACLGSAPMAAGARPSMPRAPLEVARGASKVSSAGGKSQSSMCWSAQMVDPGSAAPRALVATETTRTNRPQSTRRKYVYRRRTTVHLRGTGFRSQQCSTRNDTKSGGEQSQANYDLGMGRREARHKTVSKEGVNA